MHLVGDGNFVGSWILKSSDYPGDQLKRAIAIVEATTHFMDQKLIAEVSRGLGQAMRGIALETLAAGERLAVRGWCPLSSRRRPRPAGRLPRASRHIPTPRDRGDRCPSSGAAR